MFFVILNQRGESICKTVKIKRRDHAVCAVLQLAVRGGKIRDDDRLPEQLRLPHGDAFALINGRLHVNVAHTYIGVRILLFAEQHDEIFHMHSLNGSRARQFSTVTAFCENAGYMRRKASVQLSETLTT